MNYAQKALLYTATALTMFGQSCKQNSNPDPKPVDPVVNYKSVTVRMDPDASSAIDLVAVYNPTVASNNSKGIGHIYDLRLYQSTFKALTSVSTAKEDFEINLNIDNIKENNRTDLLEVEKTELPFATITATDGEFYRNETRKESVKSIEIYLINGIKVTDILKGDAWTSKKALLNGQANYQADPVKYKKTLDIAGDASGLFPINSPPTTARTPQ